MNYMQILKILSVACAVGALASCGDPYTSETTGRYVLPEGLKDCNVYLMAANSFSNVTVVRCPQSETTAYTHAKGGPTAITIEDPPKKKLTLQDEELLRELANYKYTLHELEVKIKEIENELEHRAATQH